MALILSGSLNISGSVTVGKVGINQPDPQYSLDVSGTIGLSSFLVLPSVDPLPVSAPLGSVIASGSSGIDSKPYFWNGSTWTSLI